MVGALLPAGVVPATAAEGGLTGLPRSEKPVSGSHSIRVKPRTLSRGPRVPNKAPKAAWPEPEMSTVTVPKTTADSDKLVTSGKGMPVIVGRALARDAASSGDTGEPLVDKVKARVVKHPQAMRAGVKGMMFTLRPQGRAMSKLTTKNQPQPKLHVTVDYGDFGQSFGGAYSSRMSLVRLPACALTSPEKSACRAQTPIAATNDTGRHTLSARSVPLSVGAPTVLAATSSATGDKGDYKATPLAPSSVWSTDLNTGDFSWSYGMDVPAVPGGLKPSVGLSYSSSSIDGRTGGANNQGSWVGDGFDLSPGFIERRYKQCADDGVKNADGNKPGDLCWGYDNAFLSFNGKGGELVPVSGNPDGNDATDEFKLKQDDGTRIVRMKSAGRANSDNDGEYWRLTTPDGTRYYFGYNRLPGWKDGEDTTGSTWSVPVYGDDAGEDCHKDTFADSWCQQAWRWNLDYVVDPHGNAMGYHYAKESNSYGRNLKAGDETAYTRGGYLKRIDYGLKSSKIFADKPQAQVVFDSAERCLPQDGVTCAADTIDDKASFWYDTPWDLNCKVGEECDNGRFSPSFWTRKRLTGVTAQVLTTDGTYHKADSWKLSHRWGMADTDYQLLLDSIQHTGESTTPAITLPKTTFAYTQLENRLDKTGDGYAPFVKSRLSTIADESGGQIDANYSAAACDWNNLPTPETNTTRCFPQYIGGDSDSDPELQWFNKYVVTSVTRTDRTGGSPDQVTRYDYLGGAAWHFDDDDGLTKQKNKTWSQWRGYGHVRVRTGGQGGAEAMKTQQDTYFLRGMDGDRKNRDGGAKDVSVVLPDGEGDPITDHSSTAGAQYKVVSFDKPGGKVLSKTVSRPWHHETAKKVRDWGTVTANFTGTSSSKSWTSTDEGAGAKWRITSTATQHDTVAGRVTQVDDFGDNATAEDNRCTRTTYATNNSTNILNLPSRTETVATECDAAPDRSKDVISDVRMAYDGKSYGEAPTAGNLTAKAALKEYEGSKATYLETGSTFDGYGRLLTATDLTASVTVDGDGPLVRTPRTDGRSTTTVYTPATGLPTQTEVTTPPADALDSTTAQTTKRALDLRGQTVTQTDTNGNTTEFRYDALGRTSKIWLADRRNTQTPSYEYTYTYAENEPVAIATKTLNNSGGQTISYVLYDGFQRSRQTQEPGPDGGALLSDTFYDERGLATKAFAPYFTETKPSTKLFKPEDALSVETQTRTSYDGLNRPIEIKQIAGNGDGGQVLNTTKTVYGGDRVTVMPPAGATATTTLSDARGNTIELRQLHSRSTDATYDATTYQYTPRGELKKVTDPAGSSWEYTYDQLGRQTEVSDPDKGTATNHYDDRGQLIRIEDSRSDVPGLAYVYDNIGRKTELHEGSPAGRLRAKWVYDTVAGAKGQLAESTRYVDGAAYTSRVDMYDKLYRATRTAVVIPDAEGQLQGTYQSGTQYKPSGLVGSTSYSAAGSLAGGSVNYAYEDETLRPVSVYGQGMTSSVGYSLTGKPLTYTMGLATGGKKTQVTNTYEWGTQRLASSRVDREEQAGVDRSVGYHYDEAGNIMSLSDVSRSGTDNQCFTYDYLARLTEAWTQGDPACADSPTADKIGGPAAYWQSFTYDKSSNRETETRHDLGGNAAKNIKRTYQYPGTGKVQAHTLTSVTTTGPSGTKTDSYAYDAAGNTTARPGQKLTWDAEGRLAKVTEDGKSTEYVYDADGKRLLARTSTETTLYLGHSEVTLAKGAEKAKATRYIDLGGGQNAIRHNDGSFTFTIGDHQGTGQLAINAADLAITQRRSQPFGALRGDAPASWPGTKGFVGGTDETHNTGLVHLGAREYDPTTGRFLSVDPLLETSEPQTLNGYSYSANNPVTMADPTGLAGMISCTGSQCDGEWQFKESYVTPNLYAGETWEKKYPWETSHYAYYDERPDVLTCDASCVAVLDKGIKAPTITGTNLCNVSVSAGCDEGFRERVGHDYKEMTVLDDYVNCTLHHDQTACDVSGSAFSSGGGTWAASIAFAFSRRAEQMLLNKTETAVGAAAARAELTAARKAGELGKRRAGLGGVLRVGGGEPEVLKAFSGEGKGRKGWVPDVGASGNPARYKATPTGNNARDNDTEYKMLTYIANRLGEPSNVSGSLTLVSSQPACTSCTSVIGQFSQEFPNIRINYAQE